MEGSSEKIANAVVESASNAIEEESVCLKL
jgi:hypothetical protein